MLLSGWQKRSSNTSIADTGPITKRKCKGERIRVLNRAGKSMLEIKYEGAESAEVVLLLYTNALWFQRCWSLRDDCTR